MVNPAKRVNLEPPAPVNNKGADDSGDKEAAIAEDVAESDEDL
jgi:hypothetical protein